MTSLVSKGNRAVISVVSLETWLAMEVTRDFMSWQTETIKSCLRSTRSTRSMIDWMARCWLRKFRCVIEKDPEMEDNK